MKVFVFGGDVQLGTIADAVRPLVGAGESALSLRHLEATGSRQSAPAAGASAPPSPFAAGPPAQLVTIRAAGAADDRAGAVLDAVAAIAPEATSFAVREHIALPGPDPAPTLSRVGLLYRPAGRTVEEFWSHWRGRHVPLVIERRPLFVRYVPNLVLRPAQPFDGVVEQWFADEAAWDEHDRQTREEKPDVAADIPRFIGGFTQFSALEVDSARA